MILADLVTDPGRLVDVPAAELPTLAGEAAALHARIIAQLLAPPATAVESFTTVDRGLTVKEAAQRTGMSEVAGKGQAI